jgi:hypothetical protein
MLVGEAMTFSSSGILMGRSIKEARFRVFVLSGGLCERSRGIGDHLRGVALEVEDGTAFD